MAELLKPDGSISEAVWRAMATQRLAIVQQARDRLYRVCVRPFRIEADVIVAAMLFDNKQKQNHLPSFEKKVLGWRFGPATRQG